MQLKFMRELGDAKLQYPLFGDDATDEFDTLILDARLNQAWHYGGNSSPVSQRDRAQYTRDQFVASLQNQLGGRAPSGQWVHVYLNGIYWGIYNLHERPDEHFAAAYFGGDDNDYDVIKHKNNVVNGSYENYQSLLDAVNADTRRDRQYEAIQDILDLDQFIEVRSAASRIERTHRADFAIMGEEHFGSIFTGALSYGLQGQRNFRRKPITFLSQIHLTAERPNGFQYVLDTSGHERVLADSGGRESLLEQKLSSVCDYQVGL